MSAPALTIGHGALDQESFLGLLRAAGVEHVVDVRSLPGSRRYPHFARPRMERWLPSGGIAYSWEPRLGGLRQAEAASRHVALRVDGFRAYADHMETAEFTDALTALVDLAGRSRAAVMCAESVWSRCHRQLLADALVLLRDTAVDHVFHDGRSERHQPSPEVRVEGAALVYDVGPQRLL